MLKKIDTHQLQPGMFVHELDCACIDHPVPGDRFAVDRAEDVRRIADSGVRALYIDTERGVDVAEAPTEAEIRAEVGRAMIAAASRPRLEPARSLHEEMARARLVQREACELVCGVMDDVRRGRGVRLGPVERVVEKVGDSILRNGDALLALCRVKTRENYTVLHSVSVGVLLIAFCRELEMDSEQTRHAGIGGMLHDLGKVRIPEAIVDKAGRLTEEEFETMRRHVVESRRILEDAPGIPELALRVASEHHERYDGSGYAAGLRGEAISRIGQMAAICDVYDAITSDRVYHCGMAPTEALSRIFEWSRFKFNPDLAQSFLRCIGIYPAGALVMLDSGRLAVVLAQQEGKLLQPVVRVVYHARGRHYLQPQDLDLARHGCADRIVGFEAPQKWGIDPMRFL